MPKLTSEQIPDINTQYLPRYTVSDADAYLARAKRRSRRARADLEGVLDVSYGDSPGQVLDIFPAARPGSPVQVFIHGGYWRATDIDRQTYSYVARPLVSAGATVVVPDYDLCPGVSIATIVEQLRRALVWVHRRIRRYNGSPGKVFVSGHSAGGHLAGMMAATDWRQAAGLPASYVKGCVSLSGLFDIEPHRHSDLQPDIRLSARDARRLSPMKLPVRTGGPVIAAVGEREPDLFHWQSLQYAANLRHQRVRADYVCTAGDHHFSITDRLGRANDPLTRAMLAQMGL